MKKSTLKGLAFLLILALVIPTILQFATPTVADAAKKAKHETSLNAKKKTLNGIGITYQMELKYLEEGVTSTWSSTNTKVATVDSKGLVTSVNKGTAVIKCKLTKKKKGTSVLSCVVTVKVPEVKVSITNKNEVDGAQSISLGTTYDFDALIKQDGTSAVVLWTIQDASIATVTTDGVVTPLKEGTTVLTATAVSKTDVVGGITTELANVKSDQIVINVTASTITNPTNETPQINSVVMANDNTLVIKFADAVKAETIIDPVTSVLTNSISITPIVNVRGIGAVNPGELKGVLSDDSKTLTITAANYFYGYYDVKLTNLITFTSGIALTSYQKNTLLINLQ